MGSHKAEAASMDSAYQSLKAKSKGKETERNNSRKSPNPGKDGFSGVGGIQNPKQTWPEKSLFILHFS